MIVYGQSEILLSDIILLLILLSEINQFENN